MQRNRRRALHHMPRPKMAERGEKEGRRKRARREIEETMKNSSWETQNNEGGKLLRRNDKEMKVTVVGK